jgi:predicted transcriptional regulator
MNYTITTTLEWKIYNFLDTQSKKTKKTKKFIIEESLKLYQKQQLKAEIIAWLEERYDEYKKLNNEFWEVQFNSLKIENV